jgi:hypothetical protein
MQPAQDRTATNVTDSPNSARLSFPKMISARADDAADLTWFFGPSVLRK